MTIGEPSESDERFADCCRILSKVPEARSESIPLATEETMLAINRFFIRSRLASLSHYAGDESLPEFARRLLQNLNDLQDTFDNAATMHLKRLDDEYEKLAKSDRNLITSNEYWRAGFLRLQTALRENLPVIQPVLVSASQLKVKRGRKPNLEIQTLVDDLAVVYEILTGKAPARAVGTATSREPEGAEGGAFHGFVGTVFEYVELEYSPDTYVRKAVQKRKKQGFPGSRIEREMRVGTAPKLQEN